MFIFVFATFLSLSSTNAYHILFSPSHSTKQCWPSYFVSCGFDQWTILRTLELIIAFFTCFWVEMFLQPFYARCFQASDKTSFGLQTVATLQVEVWRTLQFLSDLSYSVRNISRQETCSHQPSFTTRLMPEAVGLSKTSFSLRRPQRFSVVRYHLLLSVSCPIIFEQSCYSSAYHVSLYILCPTHTARE